VTFRLGQVHSIRRQCYHLYVSLSVMFYLGRRLPAGNSSKISIEISGNSLQITVIKWLCTGNNSYMTI
jgi:hypothetical protein